MCFVGQRRIFPQLHHRLNEAAGQAEQLAQRQRRQDRTAKLQQDKHFKQHFLAAKEHSARPLTHLRRVSPGPQGQLPGTHATSPHELDDMIITTWGKIYEGNADNPIQHADDFIHKYRPYLVALPEYHIQDITGDDLRQAMTKGVHSAAGLDGWAPSDWALLSGQALHWLARLLNRVEITGYWPVAVRRTKAIFLPKDCDGPPGALDTRVLMLMATLTLLHIPMFVRMLISKRV